MRENKNKEVDSLFTREEETEEECCPHHGPHGPHGDHGMHGPRGDHGPHGPKHDGVPPHILREIFELKEKVGKLEGMIEVILKKM